MVTIDLLSELMENLKPETKAGWGVTLPESPRGQGHGVRNSVSVLGKDIQRACKCAHVCVHVCVWVHWVHVCTCVHTPVCV